MASNGTFGQTSTTRLPEGRPNAARTACAVVTAARWKLGAAGSFRRDCRDSTSWPTILARSSADRRWGAADRHKDAVGSEVTGGPSAIITRPRASGNSNVVIGRPRSLAERWKIGSASCRDQVCQYVMISEVAG